MQTSLTAPTKAFLKRLNRVKKEVGDKRDRIQDLIDELHSLEDCCDRALEGLESAADALSEYV